MPDYVPIRPLGGNVLSNVPEPRLHRQDDFYQPAGPDEVSRREEAAEPFISGEASSADLSLQTYQEWAELNWKAPHGTYAATERLRAKIWEEASQELVEAEENVHHAQGLASEERHKFESEAGDALWCTSGVASNGGVDVTEAVRRYLRTWYRHPEPHGDITFGELDEKLADHLPQHVGDPRVLPIDADPEDYVPEIPDYLRWFGVTAGAVLDRQYGYNDDADYRVLVDYLRQTLGTNSQLADTVLVRWVQILEEEGDKPGAREIRHRIIESYYQDIGDRLLTPIIGDGLAFLDYTCRQHDVRLGDAAVGNMRKLTQRVATNTVDKSDGERP